MLGTAGDDGKSDAKDPVDRESGRVQAVACFFPPTDFLNYGAAGNKKIHATDHGPPYRAAFDYRELDPKSRLWVPITDTARLEEIARQISPVYHVTPDDPPTLIIHGDKDALVPLQQSELIVAEAQEGGRRDGAGGQAGRRSRLAHHRQGHHEVHRLVRSAAQGDDEESARRGSQCRRGQSGRRGLRVVSGWPVRTRGRSRRSSLRRRSACARSCNCCPGRPGTARRRRSRRVSAGRPSGMWASICLTESWNKPPSP